MKQSLVNQIRLQEEVLQTNGLNIVHCCNCGNVLIHESENSEIECPSCDKTISPNDCEDVYYTGMWWYNDFENGKNHYNTYSTIVPSEMSTKELYAICGDIKKYMSWNQENVKVRIVNSTSDYLYQFDINRYEDYKQEIEKRKQTK